MSSTTSPMSGLFIVGTDTDVGKTYLTARIARQILEEGTSVGVYKPACSGSEPGEDQNPIWRDVETLSEAVNHQFPREKICPQRFRAPLAPPVAARMENREIDEDLLVQGIQWWQGRVDVLLIEGIGGLLCPVSDQKTVCDLAEEWKFPLLIVARLGLGTINHTLLTVEVAKNRGLDVAGIVLNESQPQQGGLAGKSNAEEIERRCHVPILAVVPYRDSTGLRPLAETSTINWGGVARKARNVYNK
ncbi:MAG: dethiobiotin synthase, partial [Planctomycetaceae bacterium]|nr:dethiobiotin synthase [Planctomycetaceae bacterium]